MPIGRAKKLDLYEALIGSVPGIERKGAAMPYTSLGGNMFSFLSADGVLAFRLRRTEREAFLVRYPNATVEQHGRLMKDYVSVPDVVLQDPVALRELFEQSVANARSLKPKATPRPRGA